MAIEAICVFSTIVGTRGSSGARAEASAASAFCSGTFHCCRRRGVEGSRASLESRISECMSRRNQIDAPYWQYQHCVDLRTVNADFCTKRRADILHLLLAAGSWQDAGLCVGGGAILTIFRAFIMRLRLVACLSARRFMLMSYACCANFITCSSETRVAPWAPSIHWLI